MQMNFKVLCKIEIDWNQLLFYLAHIRVRAATIRMHLNALGTIILS